MGLWQDMTGQSHMRSAARNMRRAGMVKLNDPNYQDVMGRNRSYYGQQFQELNADLNNDQAAAIGDIASASLSGRRAIAAGTASQLSAMQSAGGSLQARFAAASRLAGGVNQAVMGLSAEEARTRAGIRSATAEMRARSRMGYDQMGLSAGNEEFGQLMEQALVRRRVEQEPYLNQAQIDMGRGQLNAGLFSAGMGMVGSIVGGALSGGAGGGGGGFLSNLFRGFAGGAGTAIGQHAANAQFGLRVNPNDRYAAGYNNPATHPLSRLNELGPSQWDRTSFRNNWDPWEAEYEVVD